jgi:Isocitrate lyase family
MRVVMSSPSSSSGSYGGQQPTQKKENPSVPKVPRGLRGLPRNSSSSVNNPQPSSTRSELNQLQADAAAIEQWWKDPRWKHTKRVYSGKKRENRM